MAAEEQLPLPFDRTAVGVRLEEGEVGALVLSLDELPKPLSQEHIRFLATAASLGIKTIFNPPLVEAVTPQFKNINSRGMYIGYEDFAAYTEANPLFRGIRTATTRAFNACIFPVGSEARQTYAKTPEPLPNLVLLPRVDAGLGKLPLAYRGVSAQDSRDSIARQYAMEVGSLIDAVKALPNDNSYPLGHLYLAHLAGCLERQVNHRA